jgi:hypothetical protein
MQLIKSLGRFQTMLVSWSGNMAKRTIYQKSAAACLQISRNCLSCLVISKFLLIYLFHILRQRFNCFSFPSEPIARSCFSSSRRRTSRPIDFVPRPQWQLACTTWFWVKFRAFDRPNHVVKFKHAVMEHISSYRGNTISPSWFHPNLEHVAVTD